MEFLFVLGAFLLIICFFEWRLGLLIVLIVGFAQDPLRKLTPGEPISYVVLFMPFVFAVILGFKNRGNKISLSHFFEYHPATRTPILLFIGVVLLGMAVAFVRTSNVIIPGIGGLAYLTPLMGILFFYHYIRTEVNVVRLFQLYIVVASVMGAGIYLTVWGFDWAILESVGEGLYIYPQSGGIYKLPSGLFRAPEVAAWHVTTAMCLLIVLVVSRQWRLGMVVAILVGLFLLGASFLTGRRKMIIEILIFVSVYGALLAYFGRGARKLSAFLLSAGLSLFALDNLILPLEQQSGFQPIIDRSSTLFDEAWGRFRLMTLESFRWVVNRHGYIGTGAGMASQGAQHFGGGSALVGGSGEGGVAKVFTELGVIGLLMFFWVTVALGVAMWRSISNAAKQTAGSPMVSLTVGLCSLMVANFAVYVSAAQVFGDPFILLLLGMMVGSVLSLPVVLERQSMEKITIEHPVWIGNR
ncbi:MAG: hypothetical protein OEU36_16470 [Gammaproteobacteria bacterium]|nr:hypothetical protein [Gammaproteobacteria bacterium]